MPISEAEIAERRLEAKLFWWTEDERQPVLAAEVPLGTVLQNWGLPNQTPFLLIGMMDEKVIASLVDGHFIAFRHDAWFAVVSSPSEQRTEFCAEVGAELNLLHEKSKQLWGI